MPAIPCVTLLPGREKSLQRRHPWLFAGAIAQVRGDPARGDTVQVRSHAGRPLAWGAWSPASQIRVRLWSCETDAVINAEFFRQRLADALARRRALPELTATDAVRLVNAESDGLPGLVVDRYADHLVCQFTAAGVEHWRAEIVAALRELLPNCASITERSDSDSRKKEGLAPRAGLLAGQPPPELVEIHEGGQRFLVDVRQGHKTGFYLDQRANRMLAGSLAAGREVLNLFCYSGAFGCHALAGAAARVTQIDSSAPALALANRHLDLNGLPTDRALFEEGNVFQVLRRYRQEGRRFDLIIVDPPKLADHASQVPAAARAYKDVNWLAWQLLQPHGLLLTFSCSGRLEADLFAKIVADAALDADRDGRILRWLGQAADHPTALAFPEGRYLMGLLCQ